MNKSTQQAIKELLAEQKADLKDKVNKSIEGLQRCLITRDKFGFVILKQDIIRFKEEIARAFNE